MKKTILKSIFLLSIFVSFSFLYGCEESVKREVYVTMKNNSSVETHLWTDGESIDPANKLAPGASRVKGRAWLDEDLILGEVIQWLDITVYAGRNGATLTSKTFKVLVRGTGSTGGINVVYSGGVLSETK